jgi:nitroimidazol reductase NimA-like FMN-containing flavoprotein (pyridoxamine 5'-phosphate oxidase superfamily)
MVETSALVDCWRLLWRLASFPRARQELVVQCHTPSRGRNALSGASDRSERHGEPSAPVARLAERRSQMLGTLNARQIDQILRSEVVGHLGCSADGKVYVTPISYVYDGERIYGHAAAGMKLRMLRANPQVCVQVDHIENLANWVSVIVWGAYEELSGDDEKEAMRLFLDRMEPLQASETALSPHRAPVGVPALDQQGQSMVFYRITLTERSGRFEKR